MPYVVVSNEFVPLILSSYLQSNNVKLKLFCNDIQPTRSMGISSFTEAASGGYSPIVLEAGNWTIDDQNVPASISYEEVIFYFTSGLSPDPTVYGFFITNSNDTKLLWSQRLTSPLTPQENTILKITPILYGASGLPA